MKTAALITLAVLVVGSALASMNNACKKSQHSWCAPILVYSRVRARNFLQLLVLGMRAEAGA
jgi:hypothetical protein